MVELVVDLFSVGMVLVFSEILDESFTMEAKMVESFSIILLVIDLFDVESITLLEECIFSLEMIALFSVE